MRAQVADLTDFYTRLLVYLQQITGYVDTKDRETGRPGARRQRRASTRWRRSWRSGGNRWRCASSASRRAWRSVPPRTTSCAVPSAVAQQAALAVKRELERVTALSIRQLRTSQLPSTPNAQPPTANAQPPVSAAFTGASTPTSTSVSRTSSADRRRRFARGWRAICRTSTAPRTCSTSAAGAASSSTCCGARRQRARARSESRDGGGLPRARARRRRRRTSSRYLERQADASLGGLFAAQVVEHLQPGYLLRFLELAFHKLRPGAPIVLETLNPACWTAFFDSFIRDITHVWPLHPETLRYLVLASGFSSGADRVPLAGRAARIACSRWPPSGDGDRGRLRRDVQRERGEAERADVHLPRLRHRRTPMTALARAGWLLSAVLAAILSPVVHTIDHAGTGADRAAAAIAIVCVFASGAGDWRSSPRWRRLRGAALRIGGTRRSPGRRRSSARRSPDSALTPCARAGGCRALVGAPASSSSPSSSRR